MSGWGGEWLWAGLPPPPPSPPPLLQVLSIMRQGYKSRKTFATNMNEHSSRSHALLSVYLKGYSSVTGATTIGKLHLVDLAG